MFVAEIAAVDNVPVGAEIQLPVADLKDLFPVGIDIRVDLVNGPVGGRQVPKPVFARGILQCFCSAFPDKILGFSGYDAFGVRLEEAQAGEETADPRVGVGMKLILGEGDAAKLRLVFLGGGIESQGFDSKVGEKLALQLFVYAGKPAGHHEDAIERDAATFQIFSKKGDLFHGESRFPAADADAVDAGVIGKALEEAGEDLLLKVQLLGGSTEAVKTAHVAAAGSLNDKVWDV